MIFYVLGPELQMMSKQILGLSHNNQDYSFIKYPNLKLISIIWEKNILLCTTEF